MKLTVRITAVMVLSVLVLIVVAEIVTLRHENQVMINDMRVDARKLGETISEIVDEIGREGRTEQARDVVNKINNLRDAVSVRLVYFDVNRSHRDAPKDPGMTMVALDQVTSRNYADQQGREYLCTYSRVSFEQRPMAVELAEPVEYDTGNTYFVAIHGTLLMGATALLGAVLAVALGSIWVGRPLQHLLDKTRRIGRGDFSRPLGLQRNDEFGELARALDTMSDELRDAQEKINAEAAARIAALHQLRHADRLRTVGRLAAGIAHELGTPLNVVSGRAGLIAAGRLTDEEIRSSGQIIKNEADRIAAIIRQLLDFARRSTPQRKETDVLQLAKQNVELLAAIAEKSQVTLDVGDAGGMLRAELDPGQIQQVLTNLIVNAIESMPAGGSVEVHVSRGHAVPPEGVEARPGEYCRADVRDHGGGIAPDAMEHIFEPFFTTKSVGEGTGLGLSIAYGIVQEHGGWIEVSSEIGQGSCFSVFLPAKE